MRSPGRVQSGTGLAAALMSGALIIGTTASIAVYQPAASMSAAVRLLGTTIGVGGSFDGFGLSIPLFFYGTVVPQGDSFHTVPYPAQINLNYPLISVLPVVSDIPYWPQTLKRSESVGAGFLAQDIANTAAGDGVTVIGMSQGAQVAEVVRASMANDPKYVADKDNYRFLLIGDPYQPNGGILSRFTAWNGLPVLGQLFPFGRPGPADSPFQTTVYQNQYDGFADFPAYFNVLALTNAVVGMLFGHVAPGYVFEYPDGPDTVSTRVGNTDYVTIPQYLPLLTPFRVGAARKFVDAIDPVLRVFVEMGYDRTADPSQVTQFRWTTPPEKRREAIAALPGSVAQSLAILGGQPYSPTLPQPVVSLTPPATPVTDHPVREVDTSPGAQAVRPTVVKLSQVGSRASQEVAKVLNKVADTPAAPSAVEPAPAAAAVIGTPRAQRSSDAPGRTNTGRRGAHRG